MKEDSDLFSGKKQKERRFIRLKCDILDRMRRS